jgi:predicted dehydrogenase
MWCCSANRPTSARHLRYAIDKGKHVFCEKPVAVDGPGVRSVLETVEMARQKDLSIVSGLCWRYDYGVRETIKRLLDGAIGDIVAIQENYLAGTLWHRGPQPEWSEMEYQLRNWYYFTWLSGDHNVEQHIHSLDKALWLMGDQPPLKCVGSADGRSASRSSGATSTTTTRSATNGPTAPSASPTRGR